MMDLNIEPSNISLILFGLILIAGLIGGELSRKTVILPQIIGYILVGLILGPNGFNFLTTKMLSLANIFVDICFSLILFELGKNLNIKSIFNDPWLLIGGVGSCVLTYILIFFTLRMFDFNTAKSAIIASIGMSSSAAVVFMVSRQLNLDSPVVRRSKSLVAINNVICILSFVTVLSYLNYNYRESEISIWLGPTYLLSGSIGLSIIAYAVTMVLSRLVSKIESKQFILVFAVIFMQIGICYIFDFSSIISLLFYGIFVKNMNFRNSIMNIEFGYIEDLFFLMLFVITGANLSWYGMQEYVLPVFAILIVRMLGQLVPIYFSSRKSGFTNKQSVLVSLSLAPISISAVGISQTTTKFQPAFGVQVSQIILLILFCMQLIGPILTQWSFNQSAKTESST